MDKEGKMGKGGAPAPCGAFSSKSECASCCQQGHVNSKTLLQQNPPVLNCGCWLTQVVLYIGRKTVVVIVRTLIFILSF